jgi:medium-chain acyl-[acyl-carrier-protein] hydrolase
VVAVQLPGREDRFCETPHVEIDSAVDDAANAITACEDTQPYVLMGHSLGAILAFETGRVLAERGHTPPSGLVLSGQRPFPSKTVGKQTGAPQAGSIAPLSTLPDDELLLGIKRYNGTPDVIFEQRDLRAIYLALLRADFRLAESYHYIAGAKVNCPILVLAGLDDGLTSTDRLDEWQKLTTGPLSVQIFPGGHFFLRQHEAEVCRVVAGFINECVHGRP